MFAERSSSEIKIHILLYNNINRVARTFQNCLNFPKFPPDFRVCDYLVNTSIDFHVSLLLHK